ncbi:hypothetical protein HPB50_022757 [Hyalomma asiaticum]|uniref:Uncharacterized protein n=1 Tax=Hyalomma asiaticum TaxID=266040 RepID=A0ACB7SSL5_HYAAI|nr:hypothetical protein HPB50_022757 [Hyalomma asiaticum]
MQPSHLSAKPGNTDGVSSRDVVNSSSNRQAPDGAVRNAPQGNPPRTTPRRFDDWSPLYELDSASSYSPASTESQDTPRDTSVSSFPGEVTSKPAITGIPRATTRARQG